METSISYTSRHEIEVHSFPLVVAIGVPALAIFLQAFLPVRLPFFRIFDLPLLVTIYFAVARRNPLTGTITGAVIGTLQDALTHQPIGIFGIAKTVIGYVASSIGVKVDVENPGSRLMMIFGFSLLHDAIRYLIASRILGTGDVLYRTRFELGSALANALLGLLLFSALDRMKQRR